MSGANEYVGNLGTGTFTQSAGTNAVSSNLYLGNTAGAGGTYNLGGSGQLSVSGSEYVGYFGRGAFAHQVGGSRKE